MRLQEFAALAVGDKIENNFASTAGVVTEADARGVRVRWGEDVPNALTFHYPVNSTAWMHWSRAPNTFCEILVVKGDACTARDCRTAGCCLGKPNP